MSGMTCRQVFRALNEQPPPCLDDIAINSFQVDSRQLCSGDAFVALRGNRTDGHRFLQAAVVSGASMLIVEDAPDFDCEVPVVVVDDSLKSLAQLSKYHRKHCSGKVIGITGSVGKTTAKDFLQQLFTGSSCSVYAAPKSYNSEIGLPLAMLGAPRDADFVILEYGINEPLEMDYLVSIVRPDLAALISIGAAHLEGMGDLGTIAVEKNKLLQAVGPQGQIWLPSECRNLIPGANQDWLSESREINFNTYESKFNDDHYLVKHPRLGEIAVSCIAEHELHTALLMTEVALDCKVEKDHIIGALTRLSKPDGRLEQVSVAGLNFINDSYNANPVSMLAALRTLSSLPCSGKRIAVLGSMLELGEQQQELHRQMGRSINEFDVD
ncbi:MAG: UDP-N-acetylmuramoyl-tripeptide--D-alanyl-D-alanine ligase, partial [Planctomycetota bacterium]|nr:UDP-N-acetylmuramoyl-tripeptide--D-alanyl-D-alanine ligase [Planctomycetota bacterium]